MDARVEIEAENISAGIIRIRDLKIGPAPEGLAARIAGRIGEIREPFNGEEESKKQVRSLLRFGSYKPSGRGKPASEYLLESAREGSFPSINNAVDALNFVSLGSQLPISLIDTVKAGALSFMLRRGREGESFVFNRSGQVLQLRDLLLVSVLPSDEPLATPVKDCHRTKVDEGTSQALAIIYSPPDLTDILENATKELCLELASFAYVESQLLLKKVVT